MSNPLSIGVLNSVQVQIIDGLNIYALNSSKGVDQYFSMEADNDLVEKYGRLTGGIFVPRENAFLGSGELTALLGSEINTAFQQKLSSMMNGLINGTTLGSFTFDIEVIRTFSMTVSGTQTQQLITVRNTFQGCSISKAPGLVLGNSGEKEMAENSWKLGCLIMLPPVQTIQ